VLQLYTSALGDWSRPVIGTAALLVMFSTTLTVADGFPRALGCLWARFKGPEDPEGEALSQAAYRISFIILVVGALGLLASLFRGGKDSFMQLILLATTLSFLTAPVLAILNHRAILSQEVPDEARPGRKMRIYSLAGILFLSLAFLIWIEAKFTVLGVF